MELRKEYAEIVEQVVDAHGWLNKSQVRRSMNRVALACQELADRPPRELTDAEIDKLWRAGFSRPEGDYTAPRRFIAAFLAKQREQQAVKFRAARRKDDHTIVAVTRDDSKLSEYWEWLEPAQEFEVKV